jgi:NAD-dependent deacetylase
VAEAHPNPGHKALAELEPQISDFILVTENVDSLHARVASQNVIELHGNSLRSRCSLEGTVAEPEEHDDSVPPRLPSVARRYGPT